MTRLTGSERAIVVTALRHAVPYIRMYKRKVFVLKAGGDAFTSPEAAQSLVEQVGILHQVGIRVVLVHGGGPQATELSTRLGIETRMVDGRRVTDEETLRVATMVLNGEINTRIVAKCREVGIPAVGLSGVDYGFVGDIESVDVGVLLKQLENDLVPIVSPLSANDKGTLLNVNADTVAAVIAAALGAEKLIVATGAPGILETLADPRSLISYIDRAGLKRLRDEGRLTDGMLPKVAAIERALAAGVPRVHVISYTVPDSLLLEVFTNEGTGTLVVDDIKQLSAAEQKS